MLPHGNNMDYVEKEKRILSLKFEDDDEQPLDFSTGNSFRDSQIHDINNGWLYKPRLYKSSRTPVDPKSPIRYDSHNLSRRSPVAPKSPIRYDSPNLSRRSPVAPKSPIKKGWPNKSQTPESGVSTGSLSPGRSSPAHFSSSCYPTLSSGDYSERNYYSGVQARDDPKVKYGTRDIPSLPVGLPIIPPTNYISNLSQALTFVEMSRQNYALMAGFNLPNFGVAPLSASHNPLIGQNLLSVPLDQNDNPCTRNLQEKFHISSSEMPTVNTSYLDNVYSFEQMQRLTQENLQKFQREVMQKKREDNPSKSRRAAARIAPYSNGRTDLRAFEEGGQDANGDSQGESVDMEVDTRTRQYQEKRRKNNEAAKKSRDQRKSKEEETAIKAAFFEQENIKFTNHIIYLRKLIDALLQSISANLQA